MNQCTPVHILPPTHPAYLSTQAQAQCSNSLVRILLQSLQWIELTISHWELLSSLCLADLFTISISLYQSHIWWRKQRVLDLLRKSLQPLTIDIEITCTSHPAQTWSLRILKSSLQLHPRMEKFKTLWKDPRKGIWFTFKSQRKSYLGSIISSQTGGSAERF